MYRIPHTRNDQGRDALGAASDAVYRARVALAGAIEARGRDDVTTYLSGVYGAMGALASAVSDLADLAKDAERAGLDSTRAIELHLASIVTSSASRPSAELTESEHRLDDGNR